MSEPNHPPLPPDCKWERIAYANGMWVLKESFRCILFEDNPEERATLAARMAYLWNEERYKLCPQTESLKMEAHNRAIEWFKWGHRAP